MRCPGLESALLGATVPALPMFMAVCTVPARAPLPLSPLPSALCSDANVPSCVHPVCMSVCMYVQGCLGSIA